MEHKAMEFFGSAEDSRPTELSRLVRRAQAGERLAFDALLRRFQDMAVGYCASILGDLQLAEDAAQEAFLETYRILPAIRTPEAFPAYFRLTLRKHCDRLTRRKQVATISLDAAFGVPSPANVPETTEDQERQAAVRAAVRSLPESEREAILLFYIGQRSLKEVAAFLEVPVSTVKNRLHTARRRLRERLFDFMETTIQATYADQRPSRDDNFHGKTISRLLKAYREQYRAEPLTADRTLLTQAREELSQAITEGVRDARTIYAGMRLLVWTDDYAAMPELMDAYLAALPTLSLAEEFWGKWTRIRGLAFRREAAAVVDAQRHFMDFVRTRIPGDPPVRLSSQDPFEPTDDPDAATLSTDALPIFALGLTETGICFHDEGIFDEWLVIASETIESAPKTATNRLWRFIALRDLVYLLGIYGGEAEVPSYLERIRSLADEEDDWQAPRWRIEALYLQMRLDADAKDVERLSLTAAEATSALKSYWDQFDSPTAEQAKRLRFLTNNVAAALNSSGTYDLALPLWEQLTKISRLGNVWSYLCYAQAVWATSKDRPRTLAILREAAYDDALPKLFAERAPAFDDVREDAEFLAALIPPSG